ncbi:MAG: 1-hydroxycarotenoid 3,4-desaturase CrtD [Fluviicola sp.]
MNKKAIIIGSGIAGIGAALRLRAKGYEVEVYEKNAYPGGKLTAFTLGEYRFDAGPSLFTMPQYVEELFGLFGEHPADHFSYVKHPTACHYFFEDGTFLPFYGDQERLLKSVEEVLNIDTKPLQDHLELSAYIYKKTHKVFLEQSLHSFKNYVSTDILRCVAAMPWLHLFESMHNVNHKKLNHPKLVQIFDRYATYNGSNPYKAPGILHIIPHLEHGFGTFFPKKGMHAITESLVDLAKRHGIRFHLNAEVAEILIANKQAKGIRLKTETGQLLTETADLVFCNSDVKPAYKNMLPTLKAPKKTMAQEPSSSAMIFYWGIGKHFDNIDLHNIFFSEDYETEFAHIFDKKTVYSDPTVYIHCSSKIVKSDAPEGKEAWFVMVNVPSNSGQDWEQMRHEIRKNILAKLSRILQEDIETLIEEEDYLDPVRIEQRTSSFAGALYGASSNDRMAAFFRHPNASKIDGLYFVGGSVHPGGGIPLCLLSAKIASEFIPNCLN